MSLARYPDEKQLEVNELQKKYPGLLDIYDFNKKSEKELTGLFKELFEKNNLEMIKLVFKKCLNKSESKKYDDYFKYVHFFVVIINNR